VALERLERVDSLSDEFPYLVLGRSPRHVRAPPRPPPWEHRPRRRVADDQVSGPDLHAAHAGGDAPLVEPPARRGVRGGPVPREDREPLFEDEPDVADAAVDDRASTAARRQRGRREFPQMGGLLVVRLVDEGAMLGRIAEHPEEPPDVLVVVGRLDRVAPDRVGDARDTRLVGQPVDGARERPALVPQFVRAVGDRTRVQRLVSVAEFGVAECHAPRLAGGRERGWVASSGSPLPGGTLLSGAGDGLLPAAVPGPGRVRPRRAEQFDADRGLVAADLRRVDGFAGDDIGVAGLDVVLLAVDGEQDLAVEEVARLFVFVAVVVDQRARLDAEVLDAHPVAGGQLRQVHAVEYLGTPLLVESYDVHTTPDA